MAGGLIVNNLRGRNSFVYFVFNRALDQCLDGDVYSGELPVFARYGRDQRSMWSVFNKKCSRGGERKYIRTAKRMHTYEFAKLDIAKAKTRERTWMCEWISEARILLWDITRLLVVVFLFWVHKDLSRLRGCSYHSKKLWMGRTLRRSSQGINWCNGWQNFPTFRLVILHKQ